MKRFSRTCKQTATSAAVCVLTMEGISRKGLESDNRKRRRRTPRRIRPRLKIFLHSKGKLRFTSLTLMDIMERDRKLTLMKHRSTTWWKMLKIFFGFNLIANSSSSGARIKKVSSTYLLGPSRRWERSAQWQMLRGTEQPEAADRAEIFGAFRHRRLSFVSPHLWAIQIWSLEHLLCRWRPLEVLYSRLSPWLCWFCNVWKKNPLNFVF